MNSVQTVKKIIANIEKVIIGKRETVELVLTAFVSRGHVLIEDIPGVGKTSLASALAKSLDCSFGRVQFTPDIMPSDITGFSAYNPKTGEFDYKKGVVLSNVVLADEINRTSPKTQSSLLEAMEEKQVTVDGKTYKIEEPFMVIATQNPAEHLGTFPLPESQMDRFLMRLSMGYPEKGEEMRIISRDGVSEPLAQIAPVACAKDILELRAASASVYLDFKINEYIVNIVRNTRNDCFVALGASPRASLALSRAARSVALFSGRDYVIPDDCAAMAPYVLSHRILLKQEAKLKGVTRADVVLSAIDRAAVPLL